MNMNDPGLDPVTSRTREEELTRLNEVERRYVDLLSKQKQGVGVIRQENLLVLPFESVIKYLDEDKKKVTSFHEAVTRIEEIILPKLPIHIKLLIIDADSNGPAHTNFF